MPELGFAGLMDYEENILLTVLLIKQIMSPIVNCNFTNMNETKEKPIFNSRIFWDVNFDALDYDKRSRFVIERVFERGDVDDIRQCRRYYGDEKIEEILTTAKWLSKQTIYLASAILDNDLSDYKCYNLAQLNPQLWHY